MPLLIYPEITLQIDSNLIMMPWLSREIWLKKKQNESFNRYITITALHQGGPIPHNMAKTFDGPPTLERSGSEHRVGRFPSSRLRREDRDERWSLL